MGCSFVNYISTVLALFTILALMCSADMPSYPIVPLGVYRSHPAF
jgi:hypothetical protein